MAEAGSFDPVWERKYAAGHAQRYPWDAVVSFVYRNAPCDRPLAEVRILEVGCGTAANLWFAAREGFSVAGIDGSRSAVEAARARFEQEGLSGDLRVALLPELPFADASFDLVLDRAAITCVGRSVAWKTFAEIRRVLKPGGRLLFNPYSDRHSSLASGRAGPDGVVLDIERGTLAGFGQICFYDRDQVLQILEGFRIKGLQHLELEETLGADPSLHAEWRVIAERGA